MSRESEPNVRRGGARSNVSEQRSARGCHSVSGQVAMDCQAVRDSIATPRERFVPLPNVLRGASNDNAEVRPGPIKNSVCSPGGLGLVRAL